jgi:hypothetical protein
LLTISNTGLVSSSSMTCTSWFYWLATAKRSWRHCFLMLWSQLFVSSFIGILYAKKHQRGPWAWDLGPCTGKHHFKQETS